MFTVALKPQNISLKIIILEENFKWHRGCGFCIWTLQIYKFKIKV